MTNRNLERYGQWSATVLPDAVDDYDGPLAGMASGLERAATELMLTVPCDSPFMPDDLAARMAAQLRASGGELAVASDGSRLHPVFLLLKRSLLQSMVAFLDAGGRKIDKWFEPLAVIEGIEPKSQHVGFRYRPGSFTGTAPE